jgi:hypothetical protein
VALNQLINVAVAEKLSALRVGEAPMKGDELLPTKRRKAQTGKALK